MKTPTTTVEFLDALIAKLHAEGKIPRRSDNAIAGLLGVKRQTISHYRNKNVDLSDEVAMRVADLLEMNRLYVISCMHAQREKSDKVKTFWKVTAQQIGTAAALTFLVVNLSSSELDAIGQGTDIATLSSAPNAEQCILC